MTFHQEQGCQKTSKVWRGKRKKLFKFPFFKSERKYIPSQLKSKKTKQKKKKKNLDRIYCKQYTD